ncbi:palmdelphin isoform X2 [Antennarius striatus]|uniref:palmdelphin isoform X2 n=1 Tax=Antennarius striatus TaxID=241820 RepID=UPI0035AD91C9
MEEFDLLKERLQAIIDKRHIQEEIRQKKLELDQEKLRLQHLKKKSLREQWLLQDSASHNATDSLRQQNFQWEQQQTKNLQFSIHRIEMEVQSLERQESIISTNESLILNRLKAVEKSSEDIIKEVQDSFIPEPLEVPTGIRNVLECFSPPTNNHSEPNRPRKSETISSTFSLFAKEIDLRRNLSTGVSKVLSKLPPEEANRHPGLKESLDLRHVSELSANEVKQLLQSASMHYHTKHHNANHQPHCRSKESWSYSDCGEGDRACGCDLRQQTTCHSSHLFRNNVLEKHLTCSDQWLGKPGVEHLGSHQESRYSWQEVRNNRSNLTNYNKLGHNDQKDRSYSSCLVDNCHQEDSHSVHQTNGNCRSNSLVNGGQVNGSRLPRLHDQKVANDYQPQLYYTPASYIPLRDYISVDEDKLYCVNPSSYARVPSPLYADDTPYTILNTLDSTEPITAVFMGFQKAQDDSRQGQEFDGSLKAELVVIEDNDAGGDDNSMKEKNYSHPKVSRANESVGHEGGAGNRWTESIKKTKNRHKACCAIS